MLLSRALREGQDLGIMVHCFQVVLSLVLQILISTRFFWFLVFVLTVHQNAMVSSVLIFRGWFLISRVS